MARNINFIPEEKLKKALNVFWNKGYTAASIANLTTAMKLNKSSFYNSFGDKHTLFKDCLKAYQNMVEAERSSILKQSNTAIEKIDSIIDSVIGTSTENENSCMSVKTAFELESHDKEIHAIMKSGNDKIIGLITSLIKEAQEYGQINAKRDSQVTAHFIFNSFAGLRQSYIIYGDRNLVKKMGAELKAFVRS